VIARRCLPKGFLATQCIAGKRSEGCWRPSVPARGAARRVNHGDAASSSSTQSAAPGAARMIVGPQECAAALPLAAEQVSKPRENFGGGGELA